MIDIDKNKMESWIDNSPLTKQNRIDCEHDMKLVHNAIRKAIKNKHTINHQIAYYLSEIKEQLKRFKITSSIGNSDRCYLLNYFKHLGYKHESAITLIRLMKKKNCKLIERI